MTTAWIRSPYLAWLIFVSLSATAETPMMAASGQTMIALNKDGTSWVVGNSTAAWPGSSSPIKAFQLPNIVMVATSGFGTEYALIADGTVWSSGSNYGGALGDGTKDASRSSAGQIANLSGVAAISAGNGSAYALKNDGTVWAWGGNANGQLGDGTITSRSLPVQVSGLQNVTRIYAGGINAIALTTDGTAWVWGGLCCGATGNGQSTIDPVVYPVHVQHLDHVVQVAASNQHNLALRSDGTVWAWGNNLEGQLGIGTTAFPLYPTQVVGLENVIAVSALGDASLALKSDGTVWAWGSNLNGELGIAGGAASLVPIRVPGLTSIVAIAGSASSGYAMATDGTVYAWGRNDSFQLGDGSMNARATPMAVSGPGGQGTLNLLSPSSISYNKIPSCSFTLSQSSGLAPLDVTASAQSSDSDGSISSYVWSSSDGQSANGQAAAFRYSEVGTFDLTLVVTDNQSGKCNARQTILVDFNPATSIQAVAKVTTADATSLGLSTDGRVWIWGANFSTLPTSTRITDAIDVVGGHWTSWVLTQNGAMYASGSNEDGALGVDVSGGGGTSPTSFVHVVGLPVIKSMADGGGRDHQIVLSADGHVYGWGRNLEGQLGVGDLINRQTPVLIPDLDQVVQVAAGDMNSYSLALRADGSVWAWGGNSAYELGDGTNVSRATPQQVPGLKNITRIFPGGSYWFAVDQQGAVWGVGSGPFFGNMSSQDLRHGPVRLAQLDRFIKLAGTWRYGLALGSDGTVWNWGLSGTGTGSALGLPGTSNLTVPTQIAGIADAIDIQAGLYSAMILRRDGTILSWGTNPWGQIGDGTLAQQQNPVLVVNETADGFLDLIPEVPNSIPRDKIPPFFVTTFANGGLTSTTLYTDLRGLMASGAFASANGFGTFASGYNVYVAANVPASTVYPYFQLNPNFSWSPLVWPMGQFLSGVTLNSQDAIVRAQILQNTDLSSPTLASTSIIVGYGTDPNEMLTNNRYRTIFTVPTQ